MYNLNVFRFICINILLIITSNLFAANRYHCPPIPLVYKECGSGELSTLFSKAQTAVSCGEYTLAKSYAKQLKHLSAKYSICWDYGNVVEKYNLILGYVALREKNISDAKKHLLASCESPGSPQLNSFGPSMFLANILLEKGHKEVVLDYLSRCKCFADSDSYLAKDIERWKQNIISGKKPDFSYKVDLVVPYDPSLGLLKASEKKDYCGGIQPDLSLERFIIGNYSVTNDFSSEKIIIVVGNLNWSTTDKSLRAGFEKYGNISESMVVRDGGDGCSMGLGFVIFDSNADAIKAIKKMNGAKLDGLRIVVRRVDNVQKNQVDSLRRSNLVPDGSVTISPLEVLRRKKSIPCIGCSGKMAQGCFNCCDSKYRGDLKQIRDCKISCEKSHEE